MEIAVNKNGTELTLSPAGRIDTSTAPQVKEAVNKNISGVTSLTFDFKKLNYLSSAGLRVLLSTQKIMNKQGDMKIININEDIMEIFEMTGLCDVFHFE